MATYTSKTRLKDKKIILCAKVKGTDGDGFPVDGFMPIHPEPSLWAYFKQLSSSLFFASAQVNVKEECVFFINHRALEPNQAELLFIKYGNSIYSVTRIDPYEGYTRDLALYAKFAQPAKEVTLLDYDKTTIDDALS